MSQKTEILRVLSLLVKRSAHGEYITIGDFDCESPVDGGDKFTRLAARICDLQLEEYKENGQKTGVRKYDLPIESKFVQLGKQRVKGYWLSESSLVKARAILLRLQAKDNHTPHPTSKGAGATTTAPAPLGVLSTEVATPSEDLRWAGKETQETPSRFPGSPTSPTGPDGPGGGEVLSLFDTPQVRPRPAIYDDDSESGRAA